MQVVPWFVMLCFLCACVLAVYACSHKEVTSVCYPAGIETKSPRCCVKRQWQAMRLRLSIWRLQQPCSSSSRWACCVHIYAACPCQQAGAPEEGAGSSYAVNVFLSCMCSFHSHIACLPANDAGAVLSPCLDHLCLLCLAVVACLHLRAAAPAAARTCCSSTPLLFRHRDARREH
jgi:hypothetical protein